MSSEFAATDARSDSAITKALGSVDAAIEHLAHMVDRVEKTFQTVLRPEPPSPGATELKAAGISSNSAMADSLERIRVQVNEMAGRLAEACNRSDL